jgi:hypothetical protein
MWFENRLALDTEAWSYRLEPIGESLRSITGIPVATCARVTQTRQFSLSTLLRGISATYTLSGKTATTSRQT